MATKTDFTNSINTALSIVINKAKVLLGFDKVTLELYPDPITETQTSVNKVTASGSTKHFSITHYKQGNKVDVSGVIENKTGALLANASFFTFTNADYLTTGGKTFFGVSLNDKRNIKFILFEGELQCIDAIANNEIVSINFNFYTDN